MENYLVIHGPNLNLLGEREPEIYGDMTLLELNRQICQFADKLGVALKLFQSNHEGEIIDFLHEHREWTRGVILNPGALSHYSYALRDAIAGINRPVIEVHLSNVMEREVFRRQSVLNDVCCNRYYGMGLNGYLRAIEYFFSQTTIELVSDCIEKHESIDTILIETVKLLYERYSKNNWVGIYLLEGNELVLHNYLGPPTPHVRIPVGKGICGAAVARAESIIVDDVNADPRYLACSVETKSEIVSPIFASGNIIGEIDIDSNLKNSFHQDDLNMLETCGRLLGVKMASTGLTNNSYAKSPRKLSKE